MVADEQLQGRAQEHVQPLEAEQAGQPADAGQALGQALQQHLVQSFQSSLAEHLTQTVRQRIEQELEPVCKELRQEVPQAHEPSRPEEQQPVQPPPEEPAPQAEEQRAQLGPADGQQDIQGFQPGLFCMWLNVTRRLMQQQGDQRLHSLLDNLFSESVRTTLQQKTEQKFRLWFQTGFEAVVGGSAGRDLQQEMEQTLAPLLQEAFDALFAGPARAEVQWHGEQVIQALLHGDCEAPRQHAEQAFQSLLRGTLTVLQHHPEQVEQLLRIIFKVLLKASQGALGSLLKEHLGTTATALAASSASPPTCSGRVPPAPQAGRAAADRAGGGAGPQRAPAGGRAGT